MKTITTKWGLGRGILVLGVAALVGLAMAGEAAAGEKVTFRMNWYWGGIHAPFALAKERGYFEKAGIDVEILEGKGSATTVQLVGNKSDMFGWADGVTLALNASKGVPVKAVATILNMLPYAVVSLEEKNIRTAKDLEGKSLAITPGDGLTQTWPAVVAANNLNADRIKLIHMDPKAKIPAVTEGRADALLGGADDQAITIEAKGFKTRVLKFSDMGVTSVGFTILTHVDTLREKPDLVRRVVAASIKGFEDALKDPDAAVAALKKIAPLADAAIVKRQLEVDLSFLFSQNNPQRRIGYGPPQDWEMTYDLLKKYRGMVTDQPVTAFYTNEFLP
jgi:NitT/TauT family transport system substrate-binding protein